MTEDKLNHIETALAHHDIQLADLSEMIGLQWKEIDRLKRQLEKTQSKIDEIGTGGEENKINSVTDMAAAEKPPHY